MKSNLTSHLYQFKNSTNYFFRFRRGFFRASRYHVTKGYFIASLRTSCVREAKWLAAFIRKEFEKDMEKRRMIDTDVKIRKPKAKTAEPADGDVCLPMERANTALDRVNNLTQSILAKAFRGELTEKWRGATNRDLISGDNSAEALLTKIKAERDALASKKKPKKKSVKKGKI